MNKTVTCLFDSEHHARTAAKDLERIGIAPGDCEVWSTPHNLAPMLEDCGVDHATANAYANAVIGGGTVLIVSYDNAQVPGVVDILDREGIPVPGLIERPEEADSSAHPASSEASTAQPEAVRFRRVQVYVRREQRAPR